MNNNLTPEEEKFLYGSSTSMCIIAFITAVIAIIFTSLFIDSIIVFFLVWFLLILSAGGIRQLYVKNKIKSYYKNANKK